MSGDGFAFCLCAEEERSFESFRNLFGTIFGSSGAKGVIGRSRTTRVEFFLEFIIFSV